MNTSHALGVRDGGRHRSPWEKIGIGDPFAARMVGPSGTGRITESMAQLENQTKEPVAPELRMAMLSDLGTTADRGVA